jgi:hypothetical protein
MKKNGKFNPKHHLKGCNTQRGHHSSYFYPSERERELLLADLDPKSS